MVVTYGKELQARVWNTKLNHFSLSEETNVFSTKNLLKIFKYSGKLKVCLITSGKCVESLSHWPRGLRRGSEAPRLQGLWVRIPLAAWNSVVGFVLSGIGLCGWLVTRLEESYRVWGV